MAIKVIRNDIIAKETAYQVSVAKDAKFMQLIKRPYDGEFTRKDGSSVRIRVLGTLEAYFFEDGQEVIVQDWADSSIRLDVDKQIDVSVGISQREATFDIDGFTMAVSASASKAIVKKVEGYLVEEAIKSLSNFLPLGDLDTSDKLIDINTFFDLEDVSIEDRIGFLSTTQKSIVLKECKDIVETYKRGTNEVMTGAEIGQVFGVNYSYSNTIDKIAKSVVASTYTGGGVLAIKAVKGSNSINISGATAGETISRLTVLKAGTVSFVAAEDVVVESDGTAIIPVVNLSAEVAAATAVTYVGVVNSLVFDRNSMVFAAISPSQAVGEEMTYINDAKNGFGVSINWGYDIKTKKGIVSFSIFCGFLNVNRALNAGVIAA